MLVKVDRPAPPDTSITFVQFVTRCCDTFAEKLREFNREERVLSLLENGGNLHVSFKFELFCSIPCAATKLIRRILEF